MISTSSKAAASAQTGNFKLVLKNKAQLLCSVDCICCDENILNKISVWSLLFASRK